MISSNSVKSNVSFSGLLFLFFTGSAYADIVFDGLFSNTADFSRYWALEANGVFGHLPLGIPDRLQIVSDPSGSGRPVMLARRLSEDLPVHNGSRSEISAPKDPSGSERWYSWGYYLPEAWKTAPTDKNHVIAQIHDIPDVNEDGRRTPPLVVQIHNNRLELLNSFDYDRITSPLGTLPKHQVDYEQRTLVSWPLETSKWIYLDLHVNLAGDDTGFIKFWKNGELLFQETDHINTYNDEGGAWFKSGLYGPSLTTEGSLSMYFTGVKIGDEMETFHTMSAVPEPGAYLMMLVGLATICSMAFRNSSS